MRVQQIVVGLNEYNYLLIGSDGLPLKYPAKYMKYLQGIQKTPETRHVYCTALKHFYTFLELIECSDTDVDTKVISDFMIWLMYPEEYANVSGMYQRTAIRSFATVNLYVTAILSYYRFLYVTYESEFNIDDKVYSAKYGPRKYKDFLYHVTKNKAYKKNVLKIKTKPQKAKRLTDNEIKACLNSTENIRDRFLLYLLLTTGLRIGEALSLYHEDIIQDQFGSYKIIIADRRNNSNHVYNKTGSREILINQECLDLYDDYCFFLECEHGIESNYVFVKLRGKNIGSPMDKPCVYSLFRRIKKTTNIDVHPHLFRSTYGSIVYNKTKDIEFTREMLGHSSVQTTISAYVEQSDEEILAQWDKVKDEFVGENDNE